jgi:hypothetical protein
VILTKGILEFSPSLAGHDVTPLNLDFSARKSHFKKSGPANNSFYSLAGKFFIHLFFNITFE